MHADATNPSAEPGSGLQIRRASRRDAGAVADLSATTFTETFGHLYPPEDLQEFLGRSCTTDAYLRMMDEPSVGIWVAGPPDAAPVGYIAVGSCKLPVQGLEPMAGEIRQLYVLSRFHNARLGSRLLTTALDWLASQGRAPLYVGVWSENHGAQRLYGRYGFEKVGEYGFPVGKTVDREFILKTTATSR